MQVPEIVMKQPTAKRLDPPVAFHRLMVGYVLPEELAHDFNSSSIFRGMLSVALALADAMNYSGAWHSKPLSAKIQKKEDTP